VTGTHDLSARLLVLSHSYIRDPGDFAGLFVHSLNKALLAHGYVISVVSPHADGLKTRENMDGIEVNRFRYMPAALETLAYKGTMHESVQRSWRSKVVFVCFLKAFLLKTLVKILSNRPVVIHAHWWFPGGFIALVSSLLLRVPYIVTIHGTDAHIMTGSALLTRLFRIVIKRSSAVIVGSEYLEKLILNSLPAIKDGQPVICRIPPPVEIPSREGGPPINGRDSDILSVARLTSQKNLSVLIEALKILEKRGLSLKTTIVGDGPLREILLDQISQGGLEDSVRIVPGVGREELFEFYNGCRIFVLPSVGEGLGLVIVEALLMKKAVIASRIGGGTEIIEDNVTGLLFDPSNSVQLAETISRLHEDPDLGSRLSERGYQKAAAVFSPESVSSKYNDIYQKLFA